MNYFSEYDGKVLAILNCRQRHNDDDAMVTMPLDTREYSLYQEMKAEGREDSKIFKALFPPNVNAENKPEKVSIAISDLNKRQLIVLVTEKLGVSLPTLTRMSAPDLRNMLLAIRNNVTRRR